MKQLKSLMMFIAALGLISISSCSKKSSSASDPFHLISPAKGATNVSLNPTFTCSQPANAVSYQFRIIDAATAAMIQSGVLTVPTYTAVGLQSGHTYTWNVYLTTTTNSGTSEDWTFTTQ